MTNHDVRYGYIIIWHCMCHCSAVNSLITSSSSKMIYSRKSNLITFFGSDMGHLQWLQCKYSLN